MEDDDGDYGTFVDGTGDHKPCSTGVNSTLPGSNRKWLMLAILSVLSGVNQGVCYSYAPIATIAETRWKQHIHSTELITVFFISYLPCSFIGSWLMDKKGLRYGVLLGAFLQALGASLRYAATFFSAEYEARVTLLGQIIASIAMPFMVNSPPVLSANWFPPSLRATSTSIAVNTNAIGTALVYLTAPFIVQTQQDLPTWNLCVAVAAVLSWAFAHFFFRSFPRSSSRFEDESIASDVHLQEEYDWQQWWNAFSHKGFWSTVLAFSVAECVVNAISALLGKFLRAEGYSKPEVGMIGAAFIASTLLGGHVISQYVDKKRKHTEAMRCCLLLTAVFMAAFKLTLSVNGVLMFASLMMLGASLGPLQPVALELGVECAFPTSEATVAALQQLCGNMLSAVLVPGLSLLRRAHADATGHVPTKFFYASPEWVMAIVMALTFVAFCFYNGEYKRFDHESRFSRFLPSQALLLTNNKPSVATKTPSYLTLTVKKTEDIDIVDQSNSDGVLRYPAPVVKFQ